MATMQMGNTLCTVQYVDAGDAGGTYDGSTPANALLNIPTAAGMSDNVVYLCRREETATITIANSTNTSANHIYIIGMPLSTDELYERTPAEAKSAWDADIETYALLKYAAYNSQMIFSDIDNFGMHRLWIIRPSGGNGPSASKGNIDIRSASAELSAFFTNCKITDEGIDLESIAVNTTETGAVIAFVGGKSCRVTDCYFQFPQNYNASQGNGAYQGVHISNFDNAVFNDNVIWTNSTSSYTGGGQMIFLTDIWRLEVQRNDMYLVVQDRSAIGFFDLFYFSDNWEVRATDNNISIDRWIAQGNVTSAGIHYAFLLTDRTVNNKSGEWIVQRISVALDEITHTNASTMYIKKSGSGGSAVANAPSSVMSDIACTKSTTSVLGLGTHAAMDLYLGSEFTTIENVTAHGPVLGIGLTVTYGANGPCPVYKGVSIKGTFTLYYVPFMEITSWVCDKISANIAVLNASLAYIVSATLNAAWVTDTWLSIATGGCAIVDAVNIPPYINWAGVPPFGSYVLMNNTDGTAGK